MKYIFGPVPSRRLGMSLGVDIVPFKTCSLDCIYCQLGVTTVKTLERQSFVPKDEVLDELRKFLSDENRKIDFITFSGSGEPTLNSDIGYMIRQVKTFTNIPVSVLTNGSLLYRDDLRKDLMEADMVAPSMDAVTDDTLMKINRPCVGLSAKLLIEGLEKFSQEYKGKIWLEIMLIKGINDHPEELKQMAALTRRLNLDKIHLNTVVRPPAENFAKALTAEEMQKIADMFDDRAEIIVDFDKMVSNKTYKGDVEVEIMSLLNRRPCTVGDISNSIGLHRNEVIKYIEKLVNQGSIKRSKQGEKWYYEKG